MIVFEGVFSQKCLKKTAKQQNKGIALFLSMPTTASLIVTIIHIIYEPHGEWTNTFLNLTIIMIMITIACLFVPYRSIIYKLCRKIVFDENEQTITKSVAGDTIPPRVKYFENVKKVIDQGDWYYITLKGGDMLDPIICQKDWLVEGTLEEFETLFKDKLIRQYK